MIRPLFRILLALIKPPAQSFSTLFIAAVIVGLFLMSTIVEHRDLFVAFYGARNIISDEVTIWKTIDYRFL